MSASPRNLADLVGFTFGGAQLGAVTALSGTTTVSGGLPQFLSLSVDETGAPFQAAFPAASSYKIVAAIDLMNTVQMENCDWNSNFTGDLLFTVVGYTPDFSPRGAYHNAARSRGGGEIARRRPGLADRGLAVTGGGASYWVAPAAHVPSVRQHAATP